MRKFYPLKRSLDIIRKDYFFTENAEETVPQAFQSFFEGEGFIDTIRNAVSLGGDADTLACIAGSLAQVYYGIPKELYIQLESYIYEEELLEIMYDFEKIYETKIT